jgi:hypothetical protein
MGNKKEKNMKKNMNIGGKIWKLNGGIVIDLGILMEME